MSLYKQVVFVSVTYNIQYILYNKEIIMDNVSSGIHISYSGL